MVLVLMITLKNMKIEAIASTVRNTLFFVFRSIFPSSGSASRGTMGWQLINRIFVGMYHRTINAATKFNVSLKQLYYLMGDSQDTLSLIPDFVGKMILRPTT